MDRGGIRGYRLLAQILLSHLSSAGPGAAETAVEAGRAWGGFLAGRPFLELAEGYEQLVCRVHLGLMQGALTELGAPVTASRLEPFAEPDACLAHLGGAHPGAHLENRT